MAISILSSLNTTSTLNELYNFLNIKKAGTFLENAEISLSNDDKTVTMSLNGVTVDLTVGSGNNPVAAVRYTGTNLTTTLNSNHGISTAYTRITGAILCSKGLLLKFYGAKSSSAITKYSVGLTVDNNGDPAMIYYNGDVLVTNSVINTYRAVAKDSITFPSDATCYPQFNAPLTSLAPVVPSSSDGSITLPYAYAAAHTQVSGEGLQAITVDGTNYITNGYWYIMDE